MKIEKQGVKNIASNKLFDQRWERLMILGARLGCHQMPERSFFVHGYQFPLCARCTGLMIGYAIAAATWYFVDISPVGAVILCVPLIIDGTTQYIRWRESNQTLRLITGVMCGAGSAYLEIWLIHMIISFLQRRIVG